MDMKKRRWEGNQMNFSYRRARQPILILRELIMDIGSRSTAVVAIPSTSRCTTCSKGLDNCRFDHLIESFGLNQGRKMADRSSNSLGS